MFDSTEAKQVSAIEQPQPKPVEQTVKVEEPIEQAFTSQGIEYYEDDYGIHDVYYKLEDADYIEKSGPLQFNITRVQLAQLYPKGSLGQIYAEGYTDVALVALDVEITNTNSKPVFFEFKSVHGKADNGGNSQLDGVLSDTFNNVYNANATQSGTIYFMYEGLADDIATISMSFNGVENEAFEKIGEDFNIKVRLY